MYTVLDTTFWRQTGQMHDVGISQNEVVITTVVVATGAITTPKKKRTQTILQCRSYYLGDTKNYVQQMYARDTNVFVVTSSTFMVSAATNIPNFCAVKLAKQCNTKYVLLALLI